MTESFTYIIHYLIEYYYVDSVKAMKAEIVFMDGDASAESSSESSYDSSSSASSDDDGDSGGDERASGDGLEDRDSDSSDYAAGIVDCEGERETTWGDVSMTADAEENRWPHSNDARTLAVTETQMLKRYVSVRLHAQAQLHLRLLALQDCDGQWLCLRRVRLGDGTQGSNVGASSFFYSYKSCDCILHFFFIINRI